MVIFPNGDSAEEKGYISLYLNLNKTELDCFDTSFKFGIVSFDEDFVYPEEIKRSSEEWEEWSDYGEEKLISHAELCDRDNKFFLGNKLTFFCEVRMHRKLINSRA